VEKIVLNLSKCVVYCSGFERIVIIILDFHTQLSIFLTLCLSMGIGFPAGKQGKNNMKLISVYFSINYACCKFMFSAQKTSRPLPHIN